MSSALQLSENAAAGLLGILSPLLKFAIEALFRSRYSNMELPSSLLQTVLLLDQAFVSRCVPMILRLEVRRQLSCSAEGSTIFPWGRARPHRPQLVRTLSGIKRLVWEEFKRLNFLPRAEELMLPLQSAAHLNGAVALLFSLDP